MVCIIFCICKFKIIVFFEGVDVISGLWCNIVFFYVMEWIYLYIFLYSKFLLVWLGLCVVELYLNILFCYVLINVEWLIGFNFFGVDKVNLK